MRIVWSRPALVLRRRIFDTIAAEHPGAARRIVGRIRDRVNSLPGLPRQGRPGRVAGTFELAVAGTPYIVVYAIAGDEIRVVTVLHHAQQWPPPER